jgi:hypothetical protein
MVRDIPDKDLYLRPVLVFETCRHHLYEETSGVESFLTRKKPRICCNSVLGGFGVNSGHISLLQTSTHDTAFRL